MCDNLLSKMDPIIEKYKDVDGGLMMVIQEAQNLYGCVSSETQHYISSKLNIPLTKVYGIVTFYSQFTMNPKGENVISVCMGTACYVKNSPKVLEEVKNVLGIENGETTSDGKFTLAETRCLGCCGLAPVLQVNEKVYGNVKPSEVKDIIAKY